MSWTPEIEKELEYISECAQGYVRMYKSDIRYYSKCQSMYTSLNISAGVLSGSLLTLSLAVGLDKSQAMIISSAFLSFVTSFAQGMVQKLDYSTTISNLKRQTAKYSALYNNISRQLTLPRELREKAKDYHYWITKSYDDLSETALDIREETITEYRKVCKDEGLSFPDERKKISIHIDSGQDGDNGDLPKEDRAGRPREDPKPKEDHKPKEDSGVTRRSSTPAEAVLTLTDSRMRYELARLSAHETE